MNYNVLLEKFVCEIKDFSVNQNSHRHELARLLFEYKVLVIRNQNLTVLQYRDLMRTFGVPKQHVLQNFIVDHYSDVIRISNLVLPDGQAEGIVDGGTYWHADMSYQPFLGVTTSLLSQRESSQGGTEFIDMKDAFIKLKNNSSLCYKLENTCNQPLEEILVHHVFGNRHALNDPTQPQQKLTNDQQRNLFPVVHHLVQKHPHTGSFSLFAVAGTAICFEGLTQEQSLALLNELEKYIIGQAQLYQHHYCAGDLVIWDNLQTLHRGFDIKPSKNIEDSRLLYRMNVSYMEKEYIS